MVNPMLVGSLPLTLFVGGLLRDPLSYEPVHLSPTNLRTAQPHAGWAARVVCASKTLTHTKSINRRRGAWSWSDGVP